MVRVAQDCEKSVKEFDNHYEGCPYSHQKREIPEHIKKILEDEKVPIGWLNLDGGRGEEGFDNRRN